jgi:hypothetical protein
MLDLMQLDRSLRENRIIFSNSFYVIDLITDEIISKNLSHSQALRLCMKDFNNRKILKGAI